MKKPVPLFEIVLVSLIFFVFTFFTFVTLADAADTDDVTATVTVQNVAMTLSNNSVTYGTMSVGTTKDTTATGTGESTYATNIGNVLQDFNIKGANSSSSGVGWTISTAAGSDTYAHHYCKVDCDGTPTWIPLAIGYTDLATSVTAGTGTTPEFDLRISVPSSVTDYQQNTVVVTVQTVAS